MSEVSRESEDPPAMFAEPFDDWRSYADDRALPPVLDAALDLFVSYGYHGTSVRMIATRARLSVPGLYHYYATKQDILVTLLRTSNDEVMRRGRAALAGAGESPRSRFLALVENIVLYMTHRRRLAHLATEIRSLEEPYRRMHIKLRDELEHMMLAEVTRANESRNFDTDDPHEATRAVLVLCRGVSDWYRPGGGLAPDVIATRYQRFALALVGDQVDEDVGVRRLLDGKSVGRDEHADPSQQGSR